MTTAIISNQQSACLRSWYHRLGGTSLYDACGNIIKEYQEFGNVESQKSPLLLFLVVCPLFVSVAAKKF